MTKELRNIRSPLISPEEGPFLRELVDVINNHQDDLFCDEIFHAVGALAGVVIASAPCTCPSCVAVGISAIQAAINEVIKDNCSESDTHKTEEAHLETRIGRA